MKKEEMIKKSIIVSSLSLCVLIAVLPLFHNELPGSYYPDLGYHLIRIEGLKEALINHRFPSRIYDFAIGGYGYGSPLFYQDHLLILSAAARMLGLGIKESYRLLIALSTLAVTALSYYSFSTMMKSRLSAALATCMLVLSQFYLADIYDRAGVSEYLALIFVPPLLAGIYDLYHEHKRLYLIGIGLIGTLLCHSITFFLCLLWLMICIIPILPKIIKDKKLFFELAEIAMISAALTAFITLPLLEQLGSGDFKFKHPWARIGELGEPPSSFLIKWGGVLQYHSLYRHRYSFYHLPDTKAYKDKE